jgi:putative DNA primase/helicase
MMTAHDLAGRLNLQKYIRSWRGTCPACDYGRVFSVKAGKDHRPVVYCANGCSQDDLANVLARNFGDAWKPADAPQADVEGDAAKRARKSAEAMRVWAGSTSLHANDPAFMYLVHRGLPELAASPALRFRGDCQHPEGGRYPALVALVQGADGRPVAVHRTYLTNAGRKASCEPVKASKGPVWGAAIRLAPVAAELVVGEGVETTASAARLMGLPAWAAISAGNLASGLVLPPEVSAVLIAADPDPPGEKAAQDAAKRWQAEGRRVRIARPTGKGDFNDLLRDGAAVNHG